MRRQHKARKVVVVRQVRVLLADDQRAFVEAVAVRLQAEPDVRLVGSMASATSTEARLLSTEVDVLVIDVELGDDSGLRVAARALESDLELKVIVLTSHDDAEVALEALQLGVAGFITKDSSSDELVSAIRGAMRDETWVSPRVLTGVLRKLLFAPGPTDPEERVASLTSREREVLERMVAGMSRADIASSLFLSPNTVRTHTQRLLAKLGVHSSLEAVAMAIKVGVRAAGPGSR